jgi:hypothetical protein
MSEAKPLVCVVILTWNDTEMTRKCLQHVCASSYSNLRVILVDNGSREPCGRRLASEFTEVELLELPKNRGFAGGGNVGIERALGYDPEYVLHLNNDAFVSPTAIERMVHTMQQRPDCGIAHSLLLFPNEDRVQFYSAVVDRDIAFHRHDFVGVRHTSRSWPVVESDFVPACVILYRAEALRKLGAYDESFGTSWEDYDLCLRFRDAGWRIITVGDAVSEHYVSQTTGTKSPYIIYHMTRNRLICISRFADRKSLARRVPLLLRSFYWDVRRYGLKNWTGHRSFALGVWDYLRGNLGERSTFRVANPGTQEIARSSDAKAG